VSSFDLSSGGEPHTPRIRRLNRLPVYMFIGLAAVFFAVIVWGLSQRGLFRAGQQPEQSQGQPASDFADEIKRGISDGIIGEPRSEPLVILPSENTSEDIPATNPFQPTGQPPAPNTALEPEADWRERLLREQEEALVREQNRQQLAAVQAQANARNSPMGVDISEVTMGQGTMHGTETGPLATPGLNGMMDVYAAGMRAAASSQASSANNQAGKNAFLDQDAADLGYLPNLVVPQMSPLELKRGSVIPATLITGINSDLPGRITAQVRQNVYDSASGHHILIPQGTKVLGRYDSEVSFGQERVLVIWTDLIFSNGSTLQIGGMAGVDTQGYGGFQDQVDNHFLRVFGSAILVAAIGTGLDALSPEAEGIAAQSGSASLGSAAEQNFSETFTQVAGKTLDRNLDVQPTLEIRPGYMFNILVDQDIIFPHHSET
jgi:type IV secretory pathway VirB10-like protein